MIKYTLHTVLSITLFVLLLCSCKHAAQKIPADFKNDNILFNNTIEQTSLQTAYIESLSEKGEAISKAEIDSIHHIASKALENGRGVSTRFLQLLEKDLAMNFRNHLLLSMRMYERFGALHASKLKKSEAWVEYEVWDDYWIKNAKNINKQLIIPIE